MVGGVLLLGAARSSFAIPRNPPGPLPIEAAVSVRSFISQTLSPSGKWLAYDYFDPTDDKRRAEILEIGTGTKIPLGESQAESWGPVWSPNGARVAYYAKDADGVHVWTWERESKQNARFGGDIEVPQEAIKGLLWLSDSERLLTVAIPRQYREESLRKSIDEGRSRTPVNDIVERRVVVRRANLAVSAELSEETAFDPTNGAQCGKAGCQMQGAGARWDLVLLGIRNQAASKLAENVSISWFAASPDAKQVAYTMHAGWAANSDQTLHDLAVVTIDSGDTRMLACGVALQYGDTVKWSPDATRILYVTQGPAANGKLVVVAVADGKTTVEGSERLPSFNAQNFYESGNVIWGTSGESAFVVTAQQDALWKVDARSGKGSALVTIPGRRIDSIYQDASDRRTRGRRHTALVTASSIDGAKAGIYDVDLRSGRSTTLKDGAFIVDERAGISEKSGRMTFVLSDQQHPGDIWCFDEKSGRWRQLTTLNEGLGRYSLGKASLIHWRDSRGHPLSGSLLLPPGYSVGSRRLPLVVWVYGGGLGSQSLNHFGLVDGAAVFNFHVFASRGYAVLYPDAPLREGSLVEDLVDSVMSGVDATIREGYADPRNLIVMGHSFGAYSVLALITETERFKAAVITGATHPDLLAAYLYMAPNGAAPVAYFERGQGGMGGTPWEYPERYLSNSPIYRFDKIRTPVLIGKGELDAPLFYSDAIFVALRRLGKPAEYRIYSGEGHVIAKRPNVIDFWRRRLQFVADSLNLQLDDSGSVSFLNGYPMQRVNP